jgi:hypothetical protein
MATNFPLKFPDGQRLGEDQLDADMAGRRTSILQLHHTPHEP